MRLEARQTQKVLHIKISTDFGAYFFGGSAYKQFAPPSLDIILENITVGLRRFFAAIKQPTQSVVSYNVIDYVNKQATDKAMEQKA